jgi:hypothetical protein
MVGILSAVMSTPIVSHSAAASRKAKVAAVLGKAVVAAVLMKTAV